MIHLTSKTKAANFETTISSASGHQITSDEPTEVGGQNKGLAPDELVLAALASCTSATLKMYAQHKGWDLQEVHTDIKMKTGERAIDFLSIERQVKLVGDLDEKQRERLLHVANKCPIHKLLSGGIEINTTL